MTTKLTKTQSQSYFVGNPYAIHTYKSGNSPLYGRSVETPMTEMLRSGSVQDAPRSYKDEVRQCRFFYRTDPFASTVVNRMIDLSTGRIKNKRNQCSDEEIKFFNALADKISPLLSSMFMSYLIDGMAVPDYTLDRVMGTRIDSGLGRKRYIFPKNLWIRNNDFLELKRKPSDMGRIVFMLIPEEDRNFILNKGKRSDGTEDKELYESIVRSFPDYVKAIEEGARKIELQNVHPVLRKPVPYDDYPQPYLSAVLTPLKHKWRIKQMDYSIATKAIEAIRHIKGGSDAFPIYEDDPSLEEIRQQLSNRPGYYNEDQESVYTLYTNHTIEVKWVFPPLDALLSEDKYNEPNSEILLGLGFSRVLLVGESIRSNSGGKSSTSGPIATLNEMRSQALDWVTWVYKELADANGFTNIPRPSLPAILNTDIVDLIQYAVQAHKLKAMTKDTLLQMFGSDYESEKAQMDLEMEDEESRMESIQVNDTTDQDLNNTITETSI